MGMQGIVVKFRCTMVKNTDASWVEIKMFAPIQFWTAALLAHTVAILGIEKTVLTCWIILFPWQPSL